MWAGSVTLAFRRRPGAAPSRAADVTDAALSRAGTAVPRPPLPEPPGGMPDRRLRRNAGDDALSLALTFRERGGRHRRRGRRSRRSRRREPCRSRRSRRGVNLRPRRSPQAASCRLATRCWRGTSRRAASARTPDIRRQAGIASRAASAVVAISCNETGLRVAACEVYNGNESVLQARDAVRRLAQRFKRARGRLRTWRFQGRRCAWMPRAMGRSSSSRRATAGWCPPPSDSPRP